MAHPTSMRLSDVTAGQLKELAACYGNQTTALTVAIDRLWRDIMGMKGIYHIERLTADGLGDTDGFTEDQIAELLRRQTASAEEAVTGLGYEVVWDDVHIWSTGHAYGEDGPAGSLIDDELEDAVGRAVEVATDDWFAAGCPAEA